MTFNTQNFNSFSAPNGKVKVSVTDTTYDYLYGKILAGSGISISQDNIGSNETMTITSSAVSSVSNSDGTLTISPTTGDVVASLLLAKPANGGFGISNAKTDVTTGGTINNQAVATGWLNFTATAPVSITGFAAQAAGVEILITNNTTSTVTLSPESASSSAVNRIACSISQVLQAKGSIRLKYNAPAFRWNLVQPSIVTYTSPLSLNTSNAVSITAASTSANGIVTTGSQSFIGLKEFASGIYTNAIGDSSNTSSIQVTNRTLLLNDGSTISVDWQQHDLVDSTGNRRVNWSNAGNGALYVDGGSSTAKIAIAGYCIDGTGAINTNSSPYSASLCNGQAGYFNNGSQTVYIGDGTYAINVTSGDSYFSGKIIADNVVRLKGYLVSNLPTGTTGDRAYVTDASSPSYGSTVSGGGSTTIPVFYDGSNWITA